VKLFQKHGTLIGFLILGAAMMYALTVVQSTLDRVERVDARTAAYDPVTNDHVVVHTRVPGVKGPAIMRGGLLSIAVKLCNTESSVVQGLSSLSWQAMTADGEHPLIGQAQTIYSSVPAEREPGCRDVDLDFRMPAAVVDLDSRLTEPRRWRLVGGFTPIRHDGNFGVRAPFLSPTFLVIAPG
jgi:hypothetical protein